MRSREARLGHPGTPSVLDWKQERYGFAGLEGGARPVRFYVRFRRAPVKDAVISRGLGPGRAPRNAPRAVSLVGNAWRGAEQSRQRAQCPSPLPSTFPSPLFRINTLYTSYVVPKLLHPPSSTLVPRSQIPSSPPPRVDDSAGLAGGLRVEPRFDDRWSGEQDFVCPRRTGPSSTLPTGCPPSCTWWPPRSLARASRRSKEGLTIGRGPRMRGAT